MKNTIIGGFLPVLVIAGFAVAFDRPVNAQRATQPAGGAQAAPAAGGGQRGGAQQPTPEGYMPRGFRPAANAAPGMRVTDLGKSGHTYKINLTKGDDIMSALVEFGEKYKIKNGHFVAVGALDKGMFGWTDTERGNGQKKLPLTQEAEIVSLIGSITLNAQGQATVHGHGSVALADGSVVGGHWFEAHVGIIAEIYVTEEEGVPEAAK